MSLLVTYKLETMNSLMCFEDLQLSGWMPNVYFLRKHEVTLKKFIKYHQEIYETRDSQKSIVVMCLSKERT